MQLSEVPFDQLEVGDRVQSDATKRLGWIKELIPIEKATRSEDNEIVIEWDPPHRRKDGLPDISFTWQFQMDKIFYIGKQ